MPQSADKAVHRAWIAAARQQSDDADRAATALRAARAVDEPLLAADTLPGYEIRGEIHRGAQGAVYRAVQNSTGRSVAIKLVHDFAFSGPLDRARFEREMHVLATLRHPNIVAIHDGGNHNGRFFLVMDYIAGQALDDYVSSRRPSIREVLGLFAAICDAVNAAHVKGIIHRDLKPANVRVDPGGRPFVLDFGLAKFAADASDDARLTAARPVTLTGQFLGSLPWAAPEQAAGSPSQIDTRTDVYSLGVVLYQMLTGAFPYRVTGPMKDVLEAIIHRTPARPRLLRRDMDDELETVVLKCLHKEPARRYQTAGELARDLRRYLAGEPIEAKRDSGWYMLRKGLRRHRLPVGVAAGFVVLLAAFGIFMASARMRAQHEADKSRQVLAFLQSMLAGVERDDPGRGTLTFREVLDHAAGRLERELTNQPEVAASVHQTLGNQYSALGLYFDADRHLRKAVELRRSVTRGDDADLARALTEFAGNLQEKRDTFEAEGAAREALDMRRRLFGHSSLEVADSLYGLVSVLLDNAYVDAMAAAPLRVVQERGVVPIAEGRAREAERLAREAFDIRRRLLGAQHRDVAAGAGMLGWCLMGLGRLDEAEGAVREAVELVRALPGDNDKLLASHLTFLSNVLRARGDLVGEEAAVREAIDIRSRRLAPDHPALAWNLLCLAQIRRRLGDFQEAETACRQALGIYTKRREPQHTDTADCQQVLAQIYDAQGRHAEAEPRWSACLEMRRNLLPPEHTDVVFAENALARNRAAQRGQRAAPGGEETSGTP